MKNQLHMIFDGGSSKKINEKWFHFMFWNFGKCLWFFLLRNERRIKDWLCVLLHLQWFPTFPRIPTNLGIFGFSGEWTSNLVVEFLLLIFYLRFSIFITLISNAFGRSIMRMIHWHQIRVKVIANSHQIRRIKATKTQMAIKLTKS